MQQRMIRNHTTLERNLQNDRICVTRIGGDVPVLGHSSIVRSNDQPVFPTLDPRLPCRVWESDVRQA
jgi:hypothetical protein